MYHSDHLQVFSWPIRLLVAQKCITKVPKGEERGSESVGAQHNFCLRTCVWLCEPQLQKVYTARQLLPWAGSPTSCMRSQHYFCYSLKSWKFLHSYYTIPFIRSLSWSLYQVYCSPATLCTSPSTVYRTQPSQTKQKLECFLPESAWSSSPPALLCRFTSIRLKFLPKVVM